MLSSMKRNLLLATLFAAFLGASAQTATPAATLEGDWAGTLAVGDAVQHVTIHLHKNAEAWTCSVDNPERGASGIPCRLTSAVNPVVWQVPIVHSTWTGTWDGDKLTGVYSEGSDTPLVLTRVVATP